MGVTEKWQDFSRIKAPPRQWQVYNPPCLAFFPGLSAKPHCHPQALTLTIEKCVIYFCRPYVRLTVSCVNSLSGWVVNRGKWHLTSSSHWEHLRLACESGPADALYPVSHCDSLQIGQHSGKGMEQALKSHNLSLSDGVWSQLFPFLSLRLSAS